MVYNHGGGVMEEKKPFSDKRWNEPLGVQKIGQIRFTEEEEKENLKTAIKALRSLGINVSEDSPGWK